MSELGDKERRFVEDQRRMAIQMTHDNLKTLAEDRLRKNEPLKEAAELLGYWLESTYDRTTLATLTRYWLRDRAKPLLDKLEEREDKND